VVTYVFVIIDAIFTIFAASFRRSQINEMAPGTLGPWILSVWATN
jgi:hypothetical protein